jgi:hypothetical protein
MGDNASNNDTMIQYLSEALTKFSELTNQTRCFAHTINLIVKSILKPFELQKDKEIQEFNDVIQNLADVLEDGDIEEEDREDDEDNDNNNDNKDNEDNEDNKDNKDNKDNDDKAEYDMSLSPIKLMLLKVSLRFVDPNPNSG